MPGKDKLLSVCCLGYRHAPYIRDCITSIWQDSWPHIEIVAMDDGSRDGSVEMLKELQSQSPCPFTVLEQENSGNVPANFNRLFKASHGDFVLFTSLDDMQIPGALEARMERLLEDGRRVFAAHTKAFALEEDKKLRPEETPLAGKSPDAAGLLELERTLFHSFYIQGAVFRRDAVEAVKGFSETMIGDDIVLRTKLLFHILAHPELTFSLIHEPGFIYRRHAGNISRNVMRQLEIVFQYWDRFWQGQPYPSMMKCWLLEGLNVVPYTDILRAFTLSGRASRFLLDTDIQEALRLSAARSLVNGRENHAHRAAAGI